MVATSAVRNLIRENKTYQIGSLIQTGSRAKMNTLDQSLAGLVDRTLVERDEARSRAHDANEFDRLLALDDRHKPKTSQPQVQPGQPGYVQPPPVAGPVRHQPYRPQFRRN